MASTATTTVATATSAMRSRSYRTFHVLDDDDNTAIAAPKRMSLPMVPISEDAAQSNSAAKSS